MSPADLNRELLAFLRRSPTPFHATAGMSAMLDEAGFARLDEAGAWSLERGGRYYVVRGGSALIAFRTGRAALPEHGMRLAGAHTDSPCLRLKPAPALRRRGYAQLDVEVYGGALYAPWFDRDLSIAGRVEFLTRDGGLDTTLIDLERPVAWIPSLAIHLHPSVHAGRTINPQKELPPLVLQPDDGGRPFVFDDWLLEEVRRRRGDAAEVLAHELSLYDTQPPSLVGLEEQFIASARLDNLLSCFVGCRALIGAGDDFASALVCNDHEEVGSVSAAGAQGTFLRSVLERMTAAEEPGPEAMERMIRRSALLSMDNAHGAHPNYPERHDEGHRPLLNRGPVIKVNASQRYASGSRSAALFRAACARAEVDCQHFAMRSDMACGSTIGPLAAAGLGIDTVDVGVATFAMHSTRELAGAADPDALARAAAAWFSR